MDGYRILPGVGDDAGGWYLETRRYDKSYVGALKAELPSRARSWRDHVGAWWIHADFIAVAEAIAGRYFHPEPDSFDETGGNGRPAEAEAWSVLWLRPGAPFPVVKAAYRALSRLWHPDVLGGDGPTMARINSAYEAIVAIGR